MSKLFVTEKVVFSIWLFLAFTTLLVLRIYAQLTAGNLLSSEIV